MARPLRIQLSRKKGWRMPPNTVSVARPGRHGNPFRVGQHVCSGREGGYRQEPIRTNADAVRAFSEMLALPKRNYPGNDQLRADLRGKNLACWCRLCERHRDGKPLDEACADCAPCHVDPLGQLANA